MNEQEKAKETKEIQRMLKGMYENNLAALEVGTAVAADAKLMTTLWKKGAKLFKIGSAAVAVVGLIVATSVFILAGAISDTREAADNAEAAAKAARAQSQVNSSILKQVEETNSVLLSYQKGGSRYQDGIEEQQRAIGQLIANQNRLAEEIKAEIRQSR